MRKAELFLLVVFHLLLIAFLLAGLFMPGLPGG